MSVHALPAGVGPDDLHILIPLCRRSLGQTPAITGTGPFTATFGTDLTTAQEDTFRRIVATITSPLFSAPDDYAVITQEAPNLRAYYQNAAPTNAESVAALKSVIRVLRALVRD